MYVWIDWKKYKFEEYLSFVVFVRLRSAVTPTVPRDLGRDHELRLSGLGSKEQRGNLTRKPERLDRPSCTQKTSLGKTSRPRCPFFPYSEIPFLEVRLPTVPYSYFTTKGSDGGKWKQGSPSYLKSVFHRFPLDDPVISTFLSDHTVWVSSHRKVLTSVIRKDCDWIMSYSYILFLYISLKGVQPNLSTTRQFSLLVWRTFTSWTNDDPETEISFYWRGFYFSCTNRSWSRRLGGWSLYRFQPFRLEYSKHSLSIKCIPTVTTNPDRNLLRTLTPEPPSRPTPNLGAGSTHNETV